MNDIETEKEEKSADHHRSLWDWIVLLIKKFTRFCWLGQTEEGKLQAFKIGGIVAGISFLMGLIQSVFLFWAAWFATLALIWLYYKWCKNSMDEEHGVATYQEVVPYVVLSWVVYAFVLVRATATSFLPWQNAVTLTIANLIAVVPALAGTIVPIKSLIDFRLSIQKEAEKKW